MTNLISTIPLSPRHIVEYSNLDVQVANLFFTRIVYQCNNGVVTHLEIESEE